MHKCRLCGENCVEDELHIICHKSNNHSIWCSDCIKGKIGTNPESNEIILECQLCNSENIISFDINKSLDNSITYDYVDGELHGENIKLYYDNIFSKIKSIGNYDKGKLYGIYMEYYTNGNIMKIYEYKDGLKDGLCKKYYENNKIHIETKYVNNMKNGISLKYDESGNLIEKSYYKDDILNGLCIYYKNNNVEKEINYENGKREGVSILYKYDDENKLIYKNEIIYKEDLIYNGTYCEYYENNKVKSEITYVNGMKEGVKKDYYEDGKIYLEVTYVNNMKNGISLKYDKNGNILIEEYYINDKLNGKSITNIYKNEINNIKLVKGIETAKPKPNLIYRKTDNISYNQVFNKSNFSSFPNEDKINSGFNDFFTINVEENNNMMNDEDPFIKRLKDYNIM